MGSILVVLVAAVDGEDGAERGYRVRRIGDLEAIAVVERGPRLFNAGDGLAALRDGVVEVNCKSNFRFARFTSGLQKALQD